MKVALVNSLVERAKIFLLSEKLLLRKNKTLSVFCQFFFFLITKRVN